MSSRSELRAISSSVATISTGFASLFGARYAVGLLISRKSCDRFVPWDSYWLTKAIPIFFAAASILFVLKWKRNGPAINAGRLSFLLLSLLCIQQLAALNLTFSDGVFFTSCFWGDWKDLEETYGFVVLPAIVILTVFVSLIVGLSSLFHRKS